MRRNLLEAALREKDSGAAGALASPGRGVSSALRFVEDAAREVIDTFRVLAWTPVYIFVEFQKVRGCSLNQPRLGVETAFAGSAPHPPAASPRSAAPAPVPACCLPYSFHPTPPHPSHNHHTITTDTQAGGDRSRERGLITSRGEELAAKATQLKLTLLDDGVFADAPHRDNAAELAAWEAAEAERAALVAADEGAVYIANAAPTFDACKCMACWRSTIIEQTAALRRRTENHINGTLSTRFDDIKVRFYFIYFITV